jgi:hypothetical protein
MDPHKLPEIQEIQLHWINVKNKIKLNISQTKPLAFCHLIKHFQPYIL